jgi:hypothetical protein
MKTIIWLFLVCLSHSAIAETYKCIQSGKTIYSSSPCGDNAQVVPNHITPLDQQPRTIYREPNPVREVPPPKEAKPVQSATPVIDCDYEEAEFEAVKKAMRAGYPASASNYWHDRFVKARDAHDSCEARRQKSLPKKY